MWAKQSAIGKKGSRQSTWLLAVFGTACTVALSAVPAVNVTPLDEKPDGVVADAGPASTITPATMLTAATSTANTLGRAKRRFASFLCTLRSSPTELNG